MMMIIYDNDDGDGPNCPILQPALESSFISDQPDRVSVTGIQDRTSMFLVDWAGSF